MSEFDDVHPNIENNDEKCSLKPLIIYVKQSYSFSGLSIQTPCVSCESLSTIIDMNNNNVEEMLFNERKSLCACPITIEILMLLSLKCLPFDVKLCNPNKMLPEELRCRMIHQLPVLIDTNNMDRLIEYRMDI
ncbi:hypothetical protein BLA29_012281, partial [Euroglyphus maynei]